MLFLLILVSAVLSVEAFVAGGGASSSSSPSSSTTRNRPVCEGGGGGLAEGAEVLPPVLASVLTLEPIEGLEGVLRCPHARRGSTAYVVPGERAVIGVPAVDEALYVAIAEACGGAPRLLVETDRCANETALTAFVGAFGRTARRVVHRLDAGRGAFRRDAEDQLLSATPETRLKFKVSDLGKETTRRRDDGPWDLTPCLRARWASGPTLGAIVLRYAPPAGHSSVLFSGRVCGFDPDAGECSAFALETDHSAQAHATTLHDLATDADVPGPFLWLLPARGQGVRFASPDSARGALLQAAARVDSQIRAGAL